MQSPTLTQRLVHAHSRIILTCSQEEEKVIQVTLGAALKSEYTPICTCLWKLCPWGFVGFGAEVSHEWNKSWTECNQFGSFCTATFCYENPFGFYDISGGKTTVVLGSPSSIQILHCSTPLFTRLACQTTDRRQSWLLLSFTVLHGHGPLNIQKWRHERQRTTGERERGSCLPLPFKTLGKKEDCQGASFYYVWQIFELYNPLNPYP